MNANCTVVRTPQGWRIAGGEADAANRFLELVDIRGLAASSGRTYAFDLAVALNWMSANGKTTAGIRKDDLHDFVRAQQATAGAMTVNRRLRFFHRYLSQTRPDAFELPRLVRSRRRARRDLPYMKEPRTVKMPLTDRQVRELVNGFRTNRDRAIVALMWAAGLRVGEVLSLRLRDIDWENNTIRIRGKGNRERSLPLSRAVEELTTRYMEVERPATTTESVFVALKGKRRGCPMTYAGIRRLFRYWRAKLNLPDAHPHRFRHTFAANMIRHGISVPVLMRLMGHTWAETTMRYVHFDDREIRERYEKALAELTTITR